MSIDSKTEGYLAQQYLKAEAELQGVKERSSTAEQQAAQYYPAVEQAALKVKQKLANFVDQRIKEIHAKARQEAFLKSLSLSPLFVNKGILLLVWGILIFIVPTLLGKFLGSFIGLLLTVALYAWLVKKSMHKAADAKVKLQCQALQGLKAHPISFMKFLDGESGDSQYPYQAIRAPWPKEQDYATNWNIAKKIGPMFGQCFVGLHALDHKYKQYVVIHVPEAGQQAHVIDVHADTSAVSWKWIHDFLLEFASQVEGDMHAIQEFALHAQEAARDKQLLSSIIQRMETLKNVMENWSDVALDEETLDRILKLVDLFVSGRKPAPKGILLYGPPGTGKTLIARKLAQQANCHFEAVNIADLKAGYIGQTAPKVKELWQRCRDKSPTILFVDECESAFARRGETDNDSFGNELVQTFISEWDGFNQAAGQVFVIAATNRRDILDNAIISRFTASVEIGLPNDKARRNILINEFKQADIQLDVTDDLVTETSGMSGRDIHTLVATVVAEHINSDITTDDLVAQVRKVRGKASTQVQSLSWDDIILPEQTLAEFQNLGKELRNAERLEQMGISTPKGILLYGPPGTGKTQIARVLAGQSGLSFIAASTSDLKANHIGQSGSKVKQLFEQARSQAPCIVFIDEIDIIAGARNSNADGFVQEIVGQLLQEIDGVASKTGQVFLLAASNHPENIDSALLSRLERKIEIGLPDEAARAKIIQLLLAKKPVEFDITTESAQLAAQTEGLSGRDLNSLVTRATRKAVNRAMSQGDDIENIRIQSEDFEELTS